MTSAPRPILLALSILAGAKVFVSAAVVTDLIGATATGMIVAGLAAVDMVVAFYLQGRVVPLASTVAYVRDDKVRAGGASTLPTGQPVTANARIGALIEDSQEV